MITAKVFKHGRGQAVHLPDEFRFDSEEVCIARMGPMVILFDPKDRHSVTIRALGRASQDFMTERDQGGPNEQRDEL